MAEAVYANPDEVLRAISGLRIHASGPGDPLVAPDLGSALATAPLITLASAVEELRTAINREVGRFADVVTHAMADVIEADEIICTDGADRPERDVETFWQAHGDPAYEQPNYQYETTYSDEVDWCEADDD